MKSDKHKDRKHYIYVQLVVIAYLFTGCMINTQKYAITKREDGGYILDIECKIKHLRPITAEGIFPEESTHYEIELLGKGQYLYSGMIDGLSKYYQHNDPGYYYPKEYVNIPGMRAYDMGYAWVDLGRKNIYLNYYWIKPPDGLIKAELHGKYKVPE